MRPAPGAGTQGREDASERPLLYECSAIAPVLRRALGPADPGQRWAGGWIFASGLLPTRFESAVRPLSGEPAWITSVAAASPGMS